MNNRIHFELQEMETTEIEWVQLIRTGKFNHALFGKFDITEKVLREFKTNFDRKARGVDIAVDYFHESFAEAAGWIRQIELRENDNQLWIKVEWTPKAEERILEKEIRYISADFDLDYSDSETGKEYGATLYGAGLTNRPHVKGMKAIFSDEIGKLSHFNSKTNKDNTMIDFNDILASVGELSEDEKLQLGEKLGFSIKTSEIEAENAKKLSEASAATKLAEKNLADKDSDIKKLSDTVKNLVAANAAKDKEVKFNEMLTNGNVVEAQRVAFMDGDIAEFAKNAMAINLSEVGSGVSNSDESATAEIKLNELASTKVADTGVSFSEAYKAIVKENPGLVAKVEA